MSREALVKRDKEMIPRALLRGMLALVVASMALAVYSRVTDMPLSSMPPEQPVVAERVVHIHAKMDGSARVTDAFGTVIVDLGPTEGGFVAGVSRALARERTKLGIPADAPVRLIRYQDGRMGLRDDLSGWRAEMHGFGRDNEAAFRRLLAN